jgi:hypothetical protein
LVAVVLNTRSPGRVVALRQAIAAVDVETDADEAVLFALLHQGLPPTRCRFAARSEAARNPRSTATALSGALARSCPNWVNKFVLANRVLRAATAVVSDNDTHDRLTDAHVERG